MRTAAVLPVKSFGRAKQRLDAAVGQPDRGELAAAMLGDVLDALRAVGGLADMIVVTAEPRAVHAAHAAAAQIARCSCRATAPRSIPPRSGGCWTASPTPAS